MCACVCTLLLPVADGTRLLPAGRSNAVPSPPGSKKLLCPRPAWSVAPPPAPTHPTPAPPARHTCSGAGKLLVAEERATGTVAWSVYGRYCVHMGRLMVALISIAMFVGQVRLWANPAADMVAASDCMFGRCAHVVCACVCFLA